MSGRGDLKFIGKWMKYINKVLLKIKNKRNKVLIENSLIELILDAKRLNAGCENELRILFAPGFNVVHSFVYHDIIIGSMLFSKGAKLHYASDCEGLKSPLMYGGVWSSGSLRKDFELLQKNEKYARKFFNKFCEISKIKNYITAEEIEEISKHIRALSIDDLRGYTIDGVQLGHDAENRVRNLNLVSDIFLVDTYKDDLSNCLIDCVIYFKYFSRLIHHFKPDRVFSHESFYYPWSIMRKIALNSDIPFYNYYTAVRKDAYTYSKDKPSLDMDMVDIWNEEKNKILSADKKNKIMSLINSERKQGNVGRLRQVRIDNKEQAIDVLEFAKNKPTAVLYGNVCWDLCALDKEIVFSSIKEAYIESIKFFSKNPSFQLIIKSHPDEENPQLPTTVEKLQDAVKSEFRKLPDNVRILPPKTSVSAYGLMPVTRCSIVYTSTVGMESTIFGTPVITLANAHYRGKGFTYDPATKSEYEKLLVNILSEKTKMSQEYSSQATKYYYYFYYELFYDYGIPPFGDDDSKIIRKNKVNDYLENKRLKKLISSIIRGENVVR